MPLWEYFCPIAQIQKIWQAENELKEILKLSPHHTLLGILSKLVSDFLKKIISQIIVEHLFLGILGTILGIVCSKDYPHGFC